MAQINPCVQLQKSVYGYHCGITIGQLNFYHLEIIFFFFLYCDTVQGITEDSEKYKFLKQALQNPL